MNKTTSALCCALFVSAASMTAAFAADSTHDASSAKSSGAPTREGSGSITGNMPRESTPGGTMVKGGDKTFFEKAAMSGMKEVSVSQSVLNNLTNPEVRAFAQMMVSDHSNANAELMMLASSKGVSLPAKDTTKLSEKWSKKTGNLDKDYIEEMVSDHKDSVDLFEKGSRSQDAEVSAFAQKTLPKLQHHLEMAKDLEKKLN